MPLAQEPALHVCVNNSSDCPVSQPEGYYFRVGSGNVLPGVEEAVKLMRSGDVWELTIPGKLAFGEKGRSASPGKPRIPPNAEIGFTLELVAVPGKDDELIEVLTDEEKA